MSNNCSGHLTMEWQCPHGHAIQTRVLSIVELWWSKTFNLASPDSWSTPCKTGWLRLLESCSSQTLPIRGLRFMFSHSQCNAKMSLDHMHQHNRSSIRYLWDIASHISHHVQLLTHHSTMTSDLLDRNALVHHWDCSWQSPHWDIFSLSFCSIKDSINIHTV